MKIKCLITLTILVLTSCSTAKQAQDSGQMTRKLNYTVEAYSRVDEVAGTYRLNYNDDMRNDADFATVEKYLQKQGLKKTASDQADYRVHVQFESESPFGGITIGIINPYTHTVSIKATTPKGQPAWELKASGPSEYEDRSDVLPYLMVALDGMLGKSITKPKTVAIRGGDPKLKDYE